MGEEGRGLQAQFFNSWHSSVLADFAVMSLLAMRATGNMPLIKACWILLNCRSRFLVNSLNLRQMAGLTFKGLAASKFAGLSCLSRRSFRFFSLYLQRNILFTSWTSCSLLRVASTVSSDSYSFTSSETSSSSSPLRLFTTLSSTAKMTSQSTKPLVVVTRMNFSQSSWKSTSPTILSEVASKVNS